MAYLEEVKPPISRQLLQIASALQKAGDLQISFDDFVRDVEETHDNSSESLSEGEDLHDLLQRSGYPELAQRLNKILTQIRQTSEVIDTLRRMYQQGRLRYGPRV